MKLRNRPIHYGIMYYNQTHKPELVTYGEIISATNIEEFREKVSELICWYWDLSDASNVFRHVDNRGINLSDIWRDYQDRYEHYRFSFHLHGFTLTFYPMTAYSYKELHKKLYGFNYVTPTEVLSSVASVVNKRLGLV